MSGPETPPGADLQPAVFEDLFRQQGEVMQAFFAPLMPAAPSPGTDPADMQHWAMSAAKLQKMWLDFGAEQAAHTPPALAQMGDFSRWSAMASDWLKAMPLAQPEAQVRLWEDGLALWTSVLGRYGIGPQAGQSELPRKDRRFADPKWSEQPMFALLHQTYLLMTERLMAMAEQAEGLPPERREQLRFMTRVITDALSPANFPLTNPVVIERTMETRGDNMVKGVEHLLGDLRKGQLTHKIGRAHV